ncbi:MAG: hypothetical protein JSU63_11660 [Phycisphaerales bacterium]|nr:MAG: hypothetical protein JSU63_11660 [Phycisphaerales bacterium]
MTARNLLGVLVLPGVLMASPGFHALSDENGPAAFVTAVTGQGATRGISGPAFPTGVARFSEEDNGISAGDSVVTPPQSTVSVVLPDSGVVIRLGPSSELILGHWTSGENDLPVTLTLLKGEAYILRRQAGGWLLAAAVSEVDSGYALSKDGALVLKSNDSGVSLAVLTGEAIWFAGSIPGEALLDESGEPLDTAGNVVEEGQSISTAELTERVPEGMARRVLENASRDLFAFGLSQGADWIERAEQGDFTPVRAAARGGVQVFRTELTASLAFDQPRSVVATPAPRAVLQPVRATRVSPARALLESGVPTDVVVGQRIRRTRVIGSPGTTLNQIRANPNVEQLIRLSGSSR